MAKLLPERLAGSNVIAESVFAGAGNSDLVFRINSICVFRRLDQPKPFLRNLLAVNLLFWALIVIGFTFKGIFSLLPSVDALFGMIASSHELAMLFLTVLLAITIGASTFAYLLSSNYKTRRLSVLPDKIVIARQIDNELFVEHYIPWSSLLSVEIKAVNRIGFGAVQSVVINTRRGKSYIVPWDDVLIDNSHASLVNQLETHAPGVLKVSAEQHTSVKPAFTELWLHEFATTGQRNNTELLDAGHKLQSGDYMVTGILGGGGQGNAYLAQTRDGAIVVLKEYVLPVYRGAQVTQNLTERFFKEAEILKKLNHPGVVKLHNHFVEDYRGYLVLEYAPGLSLKELVVQKGPQDEQTAVAIGIKLCLILKHLHEQYPPVLHRDLSPDNVLVSDNGTVKVVDFNVARQLESSATATVVGKHAYIPPEQFRGKPTCQSDIYALGGTLYYLVTGVEPEPLTPSSPAAYFAALSGVSNAHGGDSTVSLDFDKIIVRATTLNPQARYANAEALLADLSRMQR